MKLENINFVFLKTNEILKKRLLFNFSVGNIILKCLLLIENKVLLISIKSKSIGHSIPFDEKGFFPGKIPNEFYLGKH